MSVQPSEQSATEQVRGGGQTKTKRLSWFAALLISTNTILLALVVWAFVQFGSIQAAISVINGQPLTADATEKSFGIAQPGQHVALSFLLTNRGDTPIRVVGSRMICDCTMVDRRPFRLEPGQSRPFRVTVDLPKEPQVVHRSLTLYTNIPGQPELELAVAGRVAVASSSGQE